MPEMQPTREESSIDRFSYERQSLDAGHETIAGVDEAGRGPLAGPVVAAAVILPKKWIEEGVCESLFNLNDSKKLSAAQRDDFFEILTTEKELQWKVSVIESETIDRINILQATYQAMNQALGSLSMVPDHVLVDGLRVPSLKYPHTPIVKGDSLSYSIAAASICAKVTRDRLMETYHQKYPQYGFSKHKGYGTAQHRKALIEHGPCPIHRKTFAPVRDQQLSLFQI